MDPLFSRALAEGFADVGITPRLVGEDPWQWRLGPLTLVIHRGAAIATLRYARVPVATRVRCDGAAVVGAYRDALDRLERESRSADQLHPALAGAYAEAAAASGFELGRPVGIIDVFTTLTEALSGRYRRVQFSYDLARLRREHELARAGDRIDLGVATGGATARKSRVLWIEDDSGSGTYYSSFRILSVRGEP